MSAYVIVHLDHLQGRIDYPNDLASSGQILMSFLKSILGKIAWGDDLYRQSGSALQRRAVKVNALKMSRRNKGDIGSPNGVGAKEKVRLSRDESKFVNPGELSQSLMNAITYFIMSRCRRWGYKQFSFVKLIADCVLGLQQL